MILSEIMAKKFVSYYDLSPETHFNVVKVDFYKLNKPLRKRLKKFVNELRFDDLFLDPEMEGSNDSYFKYACRHLLVNKLLWDYKLDEDTKCPYYYFPLFLFYYIFPEFCDLIKKVNSICDINVVLQDPIGVSLCYNEDIVLCMDDPNHVSNIFSSKFFTEKDIDDTGDYKTTTPALIRVWDSIKGYEKNKDKELKSDRKHHSYSLDAVEDDLYYRETKLIPKTRGYSRLASDLIDIACGRALLHNSKVTKLVQLMTKYVRPLQQSNTSNFLLLDNDQIKRANDDPRTSESVFRVMGRFNCGVDLYANQHGLINVISAGNSKHLVSGCTGDPNILEPTSVLFISKSIETIGRNSLEGYYPTMVMFEPGSQLKHIHGYFIDPVYLTRIHIPPLVEYIGYAAFSTSSPTVGSVGSLSPMENVYFDGNHLRKIGPFAFYTDDTIDYNNPVEVANVKKSGFTCRYYHDLPATLEDIGDFAFATGNCHRVEDNHRKLRSGDYSKEWLVNLYFSVNSIIDEVMWRRNDDGVNSLNNFISYWRYSRIPILAHCKKLKRIGVGAFRRCNLSILKSSKNKNGRLIIPASVEIIEDYAFSCCSGICSVVFQKGSKLRYLGEKAFFGIPELREVIFDDDMPLEKIGYMAFAFTGITEVKIPKHVKLVDSCAFIPSSYPYRWQGIVIDKTNQNTIIKDNLHVKEGFMGTTTDEDGKSSYGLHKVGVRVIGGISSEEFTKLSEPTTHPYLLTGNLNSSGRTLEDWWILRYLQILNSALTYKNTSSTEILKFEWTKINKSKR